MINVPLQNTTAGVPAVRSQELDRYARLGKWLAASESGAKDPDSLGAAAALRLFYVHELGLPLRAASEANVIKGKFSGSATLHRALAEKGGYRVVMRDGSNAETCTADLIDKESGELIGSATFTIEDARNAGLAGGDNWQKYPARMLWARASKYVVQDYAPAIAIGLMLDDEIPEVTGEWTEYSVGEPEAAVSQPNPAVEAGSPTTAPGEPPLAPPSAASPEPTYPGLKFPVHAEGWILDAHERIALETSLEQEGDLDFGYPPNVDARTAVAAVKGCGDTRVLHLWADIEARGAGRVTVLRAIQARLEKLTMPLPEALQQADAGVRLLALVTWVRDQPQSVPNPNAWTEQKILGRIDELGWGRYGRIEDVPDETLTRVWEKVPASLRFHLDGMPADKVKVLAEMA